jgi:tetratricopeptide (TPR) repeat protein
MKADCNIKAEKYFEKGCAARDAGRYARAKRWFISASEFPDKKWRAICWGLAADCDEEQGKLFDALQLLRKAEICDPTSAQIQLTIGRVQLKMGKPKLAQRAFEKSIRIRPTTYGYVFLGSAFRREERLDQQKACYQSALRLDPDYEEAHFNLGGCYKFEGQYSKAEKHFRRAIKIDPKYGLAYAELGSVLFEKQRFSESYRMLRRSVKLEPDYCWARLYFAVANWTLGHLKEAEKQYREALRIAPEDSLACALLGDFLSVERRGDGEKYLKRSLVLDPANAEALYRMARHLHRNNREDEAICHLKKAACKGSERAKEILDKIGKRSAKGGK